MYSPVVYNYTPKVYKSLQFGNSREKTKSFTRGEHDILIRAVDEAGNSDIVERSFEVEY